MSAHSHPRGSRRIRHRSLPGALAMVAVCAIGVAFLYLYFITSASGQLLDSAEMFGASLGREYVSELAGRVLDLVTVVTVVAATIAIFTIAIVRRRPTVAVAAVVLVAGANATTQLLKRFVLTRPDLGVTDVTINSFPSGHTTVAASLSLAMVLAVGAKARPWFALLGTLYTAATGISTVVMAWHRPSDVIAAIVISGGWAAIVIAIGALGRSRASGHRHLQPASASTPVRTLVLLILVLGGLALLVLSVVCAMALLPTIADMSSITSAGDLSRRQLGQGYLAALAGIGGASALVPGLVLALVPLPKR